MKKLQIDGRVIWLSLAVWIIAVFFGTAGQFVSREAFPSTADGRPITQCSLSDPDLIETGDAKNGDWCVDGEVLGDRLPSDVTFSHGSLILEWDTLENQALETLIQPDFWLAIGLGVMAITSLYVLSNATGTLRTGLAAAITVIVFGLLLFPGFFTSRVPADLRTEIVEAWKLIIVFYFGTEGAVQAWKVVHPDGRNVVGDLEVVPSQAPSEDPAHADAPKPRGQPPAAS